MSEGFGWGVECGPGKRKELHRGGEVGVGAKEPGVVVVESEPNSVVTVNQDRTRGPLVWALSGSIK